VILLAAVAAASLSLQPFRYERPLRPAGPGPVELVADGPLFAHTLPGFSDLRIVDVHGAQVPWRLLPAVVAGQRSVRVLDSGRAPDGAAVAVFDLGPGHHVVDRITLDLPRAHFDGAATVLGSDDRRAWVAFPSTEIYDVGGARPARSTTVLAPSVDYRYLKVVARVPRLIRGATVSRSAEPAAPLVLPAHVAVSTGPTGATVVTVDLGSRNVPVDELRVTAATGRYDRPFDVRVGGHDVASGSIVRIGPSHVTRVPVALRARRLRLVIQNGSDPPLRGIRVVALARPRTLLVQGGHPGPLSLVYGGAVAAPSYDYARLPRSALALDQARRGALGVEHANPAYRVGDNRSFFARHHSLVLVALALAAAAVLASAALALRHT
jgi:hypothetical protein